MPQITCQYCGRSFSVRSVREDRAPYCSSGCALASRLPRGGVEGRYPVVPALVAALIVGFLFFNETLFWSLALEVGREGRPATALAFARLSAGVGAAVWLTLAVALAAAAAHRWTDLLVLAASAALLGAGFWPPLAAGPVVAANAALALWIVRGWSKKKLSEKPPLPV